MYLGLNILRVFLATKCSRVKWLSSENNQGVHKLAWTLMSHEYLKKEKKKKKLTKMYKSNVYCTI